MTDCFYRDTIARMTEKDLLAKTLEASELLDYYGPLLSEKQSELLNCYYNEDLSLAEIAKMMNVSRQAVHEQIKHGVKSLISYEEKLTLVKRHETLTNLMRELETALDQKSADVEKTLKQIKELV